MTSLQYTTMISQFHMNLENSEIGDQLKNSMPFNSGVYALELENEKYYVGQSDNIHHRVTNHTSSWTSEYKPLRVDGVFATDEDRYELEKRVTIIYMKSYGWKNVRGGPWTKQNLKRPPVCIR